MTIVTSITSGGEGDLYPGCDADLSVEPCGKNACAWVGCFLAQLEGRRSCVQHGADSEARKQHVLDGEPRVLTGEVPNDDHGEQGPRKCQQRGSADTGERERRKQEHGQGTAERRATGGAQDEWIGERIAKESLKKHASGGESGAGQRRGEDTREAKAEKNDGGVSALAGMQYGSQYFFKR